MPIFKYFRVFSAAFVLISLGSVCWAKNSLTMEDFEPPSGFSVSGMFSKGPTKANNLPLPEKGAVYLRVFKEERELECWIKPSGASAYELYRVYKVCGLSGVVGPKRESGDCQSPEGFYSVRASALNPHSKFHLSFNIGYPNAYDRAHGRTGSMIMVHGACASTGCIAIGDDAIDELYQAAENCFRAGYDSFPVHVFPFRMTQRKWSLHKRRCCSLIDFWEELYPGYAYFEHTGTPPKVVTEGSRYTFPGIKKLVKASEEIAKAKESKEAEGPEHSDRDIAEKKKTVSRRKRA